MPSKKEIRKNGYEIYKANLSKSVCAGMTAFALKLAVFLVFLTTQFICIQKFGNSFISGFSSIPFYACYLLTLIFVILPMNAGIGTYYAKQSKQLDVDIDDVFWYYKHLGSAIRKKIIVPVLVFTFIILWTLIGICTYTAMLSLGVALFSTLFFAIYIIIAIALIASIIYVLLKYCAISYIMEKFPAISAKETLAKSTSITKRNKLNILGLFLSFAGYVLIGIITLGIGFIWISPYMNITTKLYFSHIEGSLN